MSLKGFPDWRDRVARNWKDTTGYLYAFTEPCIKIAADEVRSIRENRVLVQLGGDLSGWSPSRSWLMAVVLCPDDDVAPLVEWVQERKADAERIVFYPHPDTDVFAALEAWRAAGLAAPRVAYPVASWKELHPQFGRDLSVQVLEDH